MRWVVRVLEVDRPVLGGTSAPAVREHPSLAFRIERQSKDPVWHRARESELDRLVMGRTQLGGFA